ncbi:BatD family protein [Hydrogenimonas sp.]
MKRGPGSLPVILLFLLWGLVSQAADFDYELSLSKKRAVVGEPVSLRFHAWQTEPGAILYYEFTPLKSPDYDIVLLKEETRRTALGNEGYFSYLLFPKRPGPMRVGFRFVLKRTSEQRLQHNNTGEPVKAKAIDTIDTPVPLPDARVEVAPLPAKVALVGDYRLQMAVKRRAVKAGEPLYVTLRLEGVGGEVPPLSLLPDIEGVETFADEPKIEKMPKEDGIHYEGTFTYALLPRESVTIPPVKLRAYSYTKGTLYDIESEPVKIAVEPLRPAEVLDSKNEPESIFERLAAWKGWVLNAFIFLCGYLSALLVERLRRLRPKRGEKQELFRSIKGAKEAKTLLEILVRTRDPRFEGVIERLEKGVYKHEPVDIKALRKEVLSLL